jgi:hypothetical protein
MTPPRGAKRPPPPSLHKIYFNGKSDYWETGNEWDIDLSVIFIFSLLSNQIKSNQNIYKKIFIKKREDVWIRWNIRFLKDVFYLVNNSL